MKLRHLLVAVVMLAVACGSGAPSAGLRYAQISQLTLVSGPSGTALVEQLGESWVGAELETYVPSEPEPCVEPRFGCEEARAAQVVSGDAAALEGSSGNGEYSGRFRWPGPRLNAAALPTDPAALKRALAEALGGGFEPYPDQVIRLALDLLTYPSIGREVRAALMQLLMRDAEPVDGIRDPRGRSGDVSRSSSTWTHRTSSTCW